MKVTQDIKPVFEPITLTLETYEEAEAFKLMANVSGAVANAVVRETFLYVVNKRREEAIKSTLLALWHTTPFYNLKIEQEDN